MASDLKQHKIGWIGAGGRMGYAMAERLAKAGADVAVWNRTRAKAEPLGEKRLQHRRKPGGARRSRHRLRHRRGLA